MSNEPREDLQEAQQLDEDAIAQVREGLIIPIIHRNGDRAVTLLAELQHAYKALRSAQVALRACAPNARNYFPDPGRFARAVAQHRWRVENLSVVAQSLVDEADAIQASAGGKHS